MKLPPPTKRRYTSTKEVDLHEFATVTPARAQQMVLELRALALHEVLAAGGRHVTARLFIEVEGEGSP